MDSILETNKVFLIEEPTEENTHDEEMSLWIEEKNIFRPSYDLKIKNTLDPGVYVIDVSKEHGIFCKKIETHSDKLVTFNTGLISSLLGEIDKFWDKKDVYKQNNLIHKRGVLLEGYPGTGKTSIISILSEKIIKKGGIVFKITSPKNLFYYTSFVLDFFREIQPETPIITIIEDINEYSEVYPELLDLLDGKYNIEHNLIIATSNNTEQIEDTILRPSRIDLRKVIPLPNREIRKQYFKFKNVPEEDIDKILDLTHNFSIADLKEIYICVYILDYTIESAVKKIENGVEKKNYMSKDFNTTELSL